MKPFLILATVGFLLAGCDVIPLTDAQLAAKASALLDAFDVLDTDMDNALGLEELVSTGEVSMQTFSRIDANGDGFLDRVELGEAEAAPDASLAGAWRGVPGSDSLGGLNVASARFDGTRLRWGRVPLEEPEEPVDVLTIDLMGYFSVDTAPVPHHIDVVFDDYDLMRDANTAALLAFFAGRPAGDTQAFLNETGTGDLDSAILVYLNGLEGQFTILLNQIGFKLQKGLYTISEGTLRLAVGAGAENPDDAVRPEGLDDGAVLMRP